MGNDLIERQAAIDALDGNVIVTSKESAQAVMDYIRGCADRIRSLPSAQPESLTDKEQRIFLSAMGREEEVCKQVDDEHRNCREPYEDSLVSVCRNIVRKVKGALWTT